MPVPVARKASAPQADEEDDSEAEEPLASPMKQSLSDESDVEAPVSNDEEEENDVRASPLKKYESSDEEEVHKVSEFQRAESVEIRKSVELTRDELELSKRETVHIVDEVAMKQEEEEPNTNGRHRRAASSSSESEDMNHKTPSPRRSVNLYSSTNEDQRSPSPNVPKVNTDGSVTKAYIAALNNNTTNGHNGEQHDTVSKTERPSKPVKDITQLYVENIARSTPPASPKPVARGKPAKDITQLYTVKIEQTTTNVSSLIADKLSPKKVTIGKLSVLRRKLEFIFSKKAHTGNVFLYPHPHTQKSITNRLFVVKVWLNLGCECQRLERKYL